MSYSPNSSRLENSLKFQKAQERLRKILRIKKPKPIRIPATPKRTPEENAAIIADLEAKIGKSGNFYQE